MASAELNRLYLIFGEEIHRRLKLAQDNINSARAGRKAVAADFALSMHMARELLNYVKKHGAPEVSPSKGKKIEVSVPRSAEPAAPESYELEIEEEEDRMHVSARGQDLVRNLDELMIAAEIDPKKWSSANFKCRTWPTALKIRSADAQGNMQDTVQLVRSWYVSADFYKRLDIDVKPASFPKIPRVARTIDPTRNVMSAIILPDMQIGYRWADKHRNLIPLHDWAAIDATIQLTEMLNPDIIQFLGDNLDLAAFSTKYSVPMNVRDTTNPSLLTAYGLLSRYRTAAPHAEMDWQAGNHEDRLERAVTDPNRGLSEFETLRRADDPNGPPVVSFASLLGLDALDITWRNYGESRWLWDKVLIHHGDVVRNGGGKTVAAVVGNSSHSVMFGHIHRLEMAQKTIHGPEGIKIITAATPGCLCSLESGVVPGVSRTPDWQHGVGIVWYDTVNDQEHIQLLPIHNGVLFYEGNVIIGDGKRLAKSIATESGWPQIS